jgi:hypothetical protein
MASLSVKDELLKKFGFQQVKTELIHDETGKNADYFLFKDENGSLYKYIPST